MRRQHGKYHVAGNFYIIKSGISDDALIDTYEEEDDVYIIETHPPDQEIKREPEEQKLVSEYW